MTTRGVLRYPFLTVLLIIAHRQGSLAASVVSDAGRICVGSDVDCSQLRQMTGGILTCVSTRDRVDCLKKLRKGDADFGYFEAEDLKMAAQDMTSPNSNVRYEAQVEFSTGKEVRAVYLLVHNASNTNPKTMCHPGFNRERLYPRALYTPTTLDTKDPTGDIQSLIISLGRAWNYTCIPGMWSPDVIADNNLKREHPYLCRNCVRKSCHSEDPYAGAGALQCLLDRAADAAFISDVDLRAARAKNPEVENLYHFCMNKEDPIHSLGDKTRDDGEPCDWGKRPLPVLLSRSCEDTDCKVRLQTWLKALSSNSPALKSILDLPRSTQVKVIGSSLSPLEIIKQAGYKVDQAKPKDYVMFCVHTQTELEKCQDLAKAASAYAADGGVGIKCLLDKDGPNCYSDIYFGKADLIALDGGDVHEVTQDYGFERLLSEVYVESSVATASSYYAVAVIRAESNISSFDHLQGRKSCHTGIDKTAGWKIPLATLLEQRLIDPRHCDYVSAIAEFFTGGSCAPGAKSNKYNKQLNHMEILCRLCKGVNENQCARNSEEPFYSYMGAFRCLVHGGGDVAFVKHTTVPDLTGGSTSTPWTVGLQADQFRLLCPSGGTAAISDYKTCNLALVPAHEVVVSGRMSDERKRQVRETLLGISQTFNPESAGVKTFKLFGAYHGNSDLLFKDSAVGLRSLSQDTQSERTRKKDYFKMLNELHSCEVRVCALEEQMDDCQAMAQVMLSSKGHQFVCVSARDRLDCVRRVIRGQVDMTPVPGSFLGVDPDLRILATMRDPANSQQEFRYKAVMVVRRSTVKNLSDLRGKNSCHTGYGKTVGWRIPVAMLKRFVVIHPLCNDGQSTQEHEIASVAATFNRACIPGSWAESPSLDKYLKMKYKAMCSMCMSGTCSSKDDYAGYEGSLRCLTQNEGDVAFSKLSVVKKYFANTRGVNVDEFGLLCQDNKIVNINAPEAEECYWAARPWDAYVTHTGTSDSKVQRLFWALTEAKRQGEGDFEGQNWYFTTLGIGDASDIFPVMENVKTQDYYTKSRMDVVESEEMCSEEAVRFCVRNDEEENKCHDLRSVLSLNGVSPPLQCVRGSDSYDCAFRISINEADVISLTDVERSKVNLSYNFLDLLSEQYGQAEDTLHYLVAVVKKSPDLTSVADLPGKTTCHTSLNASNPRGIDYSLTECLDGTSRFFPSYREAITCMKGSNKDIAFVKLSNMGDSTIQDEIIPDFLNPDEYQLLCDNGIFPLSTSFIKDCNLGRIPANLVITRYTDTDSRREDMVQLLLQAAKNYGKKDSFFRLFYNYFSKTDLLFKDATTELKPTGEDHYEIFLAMMRRQACGLYYHHLKSNVGL